MKAELYWQETAEERYDTEINALAQELASVWGLEIRAIYGGIGLQVDGVPFPAEETLLVKGKRRDILSVRRILRSALKREVKLTWVYVWTQAMATVKFKYRLWVLRHDAPVQWLDDDDSGNVPSMDKKQTGEATDNVTVLPADDGAAVENTTVVPAEQPSDEDDESSDLTAAQKQGAEDRAWMAEHPGEPLIRGANKEVGGE